MQLVAVTTKRLRQQFLTLPVKLYRGDKNWIRPLDKDIEAVFDPKQNKLLHEQADLNEQPVAGQAERWVLFDDRGQPIGRVAAFINPRTAPKEKQPTGGMGFFECINDQAAANALFEACREWLAQRGMEAMDGPINFGDRDRFWGLLTEGFTPPNYGMFYHHAYYQSLFEEYGFQLYFKQLTYGRPVVAEMPNEITYEKARRIMDNPDIEFRSIELDKLEKYAQDFAEVYNRGWAAHAGVAELTPEQALATMRQMKPVIDTRIVRFCYHKGKPVGFFVNLPELNQLFRHVNGKMDAWGTVKFLWHRYVMKSCDRMFGLIFGAVPEWHGKGMDAAIAMDLAWTHIAKGHLPYHYTEMNWVGDFNPAMIKMVEQIGSEVVKVHHTYRYLFDRDKPFERYPIIRRGRDSAALREAVRKRQEERARKRATVGKTDGDA